MVNEAVSVVEAHRRAGLPHELGGPLLKAVYDGEIASEHDPAGGPVPWVRVADMTVPVPVRSRQQESRASS